MAKTSSSKRELLILIFIAVWIFVQMAIPFIRKFELSPFKYRYATYSWAMFSKPALRYEVSFFRKKPGGEKEAIPDMNKFDFRYRSPESTSRNEYYQSTAEIKNRFRQLIQYIAQHEDPNFKYGVLLRWTQQFDPNEPKEWEYHV